MAVALALVAAAAVAVLVVRVVNGDQDAPAASEPAGDQPGIGRDADPEGGARIPVADVAIDNGLSVLDQPSTEWTLSADELVPDGRFGSTSPYADGPATIPVAAGDVLVTWAGPETGGRGVLAGVDAQTGEVMWRRPQGYASCAALAQDEVVACWRWGGGGVNLLDAATGEVTDRWTGRTLANVVPDGDDALLIGLTSSQELEVTRVDMTGEEQWSRTHARPGGELTHGHGAFLADGVLEVWFAAANWLVDAGSGELIASGAERTPLLGGYGVEIRGSRTVVTDSEGYLFLEAPGAPWYASTTRQGQVDDGQLGVGRALYDLATGEQLWSRLDLKPSANLSWAPDGTQVRAFEGKRMLMLDGSTGEDLWSHPLPSGYANELYTSDAVALTYSDTGVVEVLSRETGAVAWQAETPSKSEWSPLDTVVTDSAIVATHEDGITGWAGFGEAPSATDGAPDYVTECGAEPELEPVESRAAHGGLEVTFEVTAVCPDGQWLSADAMSVTVSGEAGQVSGPLAAGSFDFSGAPIWIPPDGVTMRLVYPAGAVYATADEIATGIAGEAVLVECVREPGADLGVVPQSPEYGADPAQPVLAAGAALSEEERKESALAALRRIAAQDATAVEDSLEGSWVPQLSSKVRGTTDDGITYTYPDILAEHLRLRLRYDSPGVRLVNSSDWGSFLSPGYWVTLVDSPTPGPAPALGFCREQGFDRDHCYAKRMLRDGPSEGSTRLQGG